MVKKILNTKTDRSNTLIDNKDKEYWAKVKFNSGANIAKLGMVSGFSKSTEQPNYVHAVIKYMDGKKAKQYSIIRKPTWRTNKIAEVKLWEGEIKNVYEVDYFLQNTRKGTKAIHVTELTFYQQDGSKLPKTFKEVKSEKKWINF